MANPLPLLIPQALTPLAAPASPANGWEYFDSTTKRLTTYDGSAWQTYVSRADLNSGTLPASLTTLTTSGAATIGGNLTVSGNTTTTGTELIGNSRRITPRTVLSTSFTPTSGHWYRIASCAQSSNSYYGTDATLYIQCGAANFDQNLALRLMRGLPSNGTGFIYEYRLLGHYSVTKGIGQVRVVDGGPNNPLYVDVQFLDTSTYTNVAVASDNFAMDQVATMGATTVALTDQGTTASGMAIDVVTYSYQRGDSQSSAVESINRTTGNPVVTGATKFGIDSNGNLQANSVGYKTYYNAGAVTTVDWNNGGMQYVTISANTTLTFSNGVAGQRYTILVKNTGASAFNLTYPNWTSNSTTISITNGNTAVLDFIYTGSTYYNLGFINNATGYTYP